MKTAFTQLPSMRTIFLKITVFFVLTSSYIDAADLLKGDADAQSGESFSFSLLGHIFGGSQIGNFYVSADPAASGSKTFAVSYVTRDSNQFIGLTPEKVKFNDVKDEKKNLIEIGNPLYNQGIAYLSLFTEKDSILQGAQERPVVVLNNDRKTIYIINSYQPDGSNVTVLSVVNFVPVAPGKIGATTAQNIPDATGAITSGIVQLAVGGPRIYAAVKPNSGSFGAVGSGVVIVTSGSVPVDNGSFTGLLVSDAPTFQLAYVNGNRAAALDTTSSFLKISNNLASMTDVVDMCWHPLVGRLYVGLQVTGAGAGTDGARSIAVGRIAFTTSITKDKNGNNTTEFTPTSFGFDPIAPSAAFDVGATNKIVGAVGASALVAANKVRSMGTSTSLPYLIVLGGVGALNTTQNTVFALPLVTNSGTESTDGTIADKTVAPQNFYTNTRSGSLFVMRSFTQAATSAATMPLSTDAAVLVGGSALSNMTIQDIFVYGDAVFASVKTANPGNDPGLFYSQAMFDGNGAIKGWTNWRRATGTILPVIGSALDPLTVNTYFIAANTSSQARIAKRTVWGSGDAESLAPLASAVATALPKDVAGVQGLVDFPPSTPGLNNISLLIATGYKKVVLAQTSEVIGGAQLPTLGAFLGTLQPFTNGTISQTFPIGANLMTSIEGGVLDELGPIITAEICTVGSNGWLIVGGVGGVAILSNPNGSGWNTGTGLGNGLVGLTSGMEFKLVGDYGFVRKIICDNSMLYVLADNQLDRIDLSQGNIGLGSITPTTLLSVSDLALIGSRGTLLDMVISKKLAVVATSVGLMRNGNGSSIATAFDMQSLNWQLVPTPESVGPAQQLFAVTPTSRIQDAASQAQGSNLYVLSAYRGNNQAYLQRFAIGQATTTISDTTVTHFDDLYVKDIPSYFARYGLFRNLCATDGSLFFGTRSKYTNQDPVMTVFFADGGVKTGSRFVLSKEVPAGLESSTLICALFKDWASGSWLLGTDSGLRINE